VAMPALSTMFALPEFAVETDNLAQLQSAKLPELVEPADASTSTELMDLPATMETAAPPATLAPTVSAQEALFNVLLLANAKRTTEDALLLPASILTKLMVPLAMMETAPLLMMLVLPVNVSEILTMMTLALLTDVAMTNMPLVMTFLEPTPTLVPALATMQETSSVPRPTVST